MQTIRENLCIKAIYSNPKSNAQKQDPHFVKVVVNLRITIFTNQIGLLYSIPK